MNGAATEPSKQQLVWERIAVFVFGVVFLILGVYVVLGKTLDDKQWFALRLVFALSAAGIAGFLPGAIGITIKGYLRAGGALAVFYLVYTVNPPRVDDPKIQKSDSQPAQSPASNIDPKPENAPTSVTETRCEALDGKWYEWDKGTDKQDPGTWTFYYKDREHIVAKRDDGLIAEYQSKKEMNRWTDTYRIHDAPFRLAFRVNSPKCDRIDFDGTSLYFTRRNY